MMNSEEEIITFLQRHKCGRPWMELAEFTESSGLDRDSIVAQLKLICSILDSKAKEFKQKSHPNHIEPVKKRKLVDTTYATYVNCVPRHQTIWQLARFILFTVALVTNESYETECNDASKCLIRFNRHVDFKALTFPIQTIIVKMATNLGRLMPLGELIRELENGTFNFDCNCHDTTCVLDAIPPSGLAYRINLLYQRIINCTMKEADDRLAQFRELLHEALKSITRYEEEYMRAQATRLSKVIDAAKLDINSVTPSKKMIVSRLTDMKSIYQQITGVKIIPDVRILSALSCSLCVVIKYIVLEYHFPSLLQVDKLEHAFLQISNETAPLQEDILSILNQHNLLCDYMFIRNVQFERTLQYQELCAAYAIVVKREISKLKDSLEKQKEMRRLEEKQAETERIEQMNEMKEHLNRAKLIIEYLLRMEQLAVALRIRPTDPLSPFVVLGLPFTYKEESLKLIKLKVQLGLHPDKLGLGRLNDENIDFPSQHVNHAFHLITDGLRNIKLAQSDPKIKILYCWHAGKETPPYAAECHIDQVTRSSYGPKTSAPPPNRAATSKEDDKVMVTLTSWYHSALKNHLCPLNRYKDDSNTKCKPDVDKLITLESFECLGVCRFKLSIKVKCLESLTEESEVMLCIIEVGYPQLDKRILTSRSLDSLAVAWIGEISLDTKQEDLNILLHPLPIVNVGAAHCYYPISLRIVNQNVASNRIWNIMGCNCPKLLSNDVPIADVQNALIYFKYSIPREYPLKYEPDYFGRDHIKKMKKQAVIASLQTLLDDIKSLNFPGVTL